MVCLWYFLNGKNAVPLQPEIKQKNNEQRFRTFRLFWAEG